MEKGKKLGAWLSGAGATAGADSRHFRLFSPTSAHQFPATVTCVEVGEGRQKKRRSKANNHANNNQQQARPVVRRACVRPAPRPDKARLASRSVDSPKLLPIAWLLPGSKSASAAGVGGLAVLGVDCSEVVDSVYMWQPAATCKSPPGATRRGSAPCCCRCSP